MCGTKPVIDKEDMDLTARELEIAISKKNAAKIHTCRRLLADGGDTESRREYAKLMERGEYQLKDIDTAMNYYYLAALDNDSYSAYRYSRLVGRMSETAASFWLRYSSVLGSIDSYPETAELFSQEGREDIASYYYALAAACDDTDSIVNMAKRWSGGIGVPQNDSHAKWYLDKMIIPPISAIKLAYKLRSVRAAEPPKLSFPDYQAYLRTLALEARDLGFETAEFYLTSALAHAGSINALTALGIMLTEGKGCEQNISKAKEYLDASITGGNPAAAIYLGEEFVSGKHFDKDPCAAMEYFTLAAKLGYTDAYEKLGDIYHDGSITEKNIQKALELYELSAAGGSSSAREKADKIKMIRENYYLDAYKTINVKGSVTKEEAFASFRNAAIASAMGDARAMVLLAKCYASGFGTEADRASAFFWFKSAADAGNIEASYSVGLCYSRGFGTEFSYRNALKHLKYAQNAGISSAAKELDLLYRRRMKKMVRSLYSTSMRLIYMKKYSEAIKLLSSFESLAYPKALYTLGCLYEFGRGVPRSDRSRASAYYERAFAGNLTFGNFKDPNSSYKLQILKMIR